MSEIAAANSTLAGLLAFDILERRKQELRKKISSYPRSVSILSDIGECDRQMVYSITNWKDKPLHDEELQARFDEGREQERKLNRDLIDMGYDVIAQQEVCEVKNRSGDVIARGKIDGKIVYQKVKIPYECKSLNVNVFDSLETVEDFYKKPWLRKYIRQIQMYLYGNNCEEGLLICTDCLGHIKLFVITLDYGEAEAILQRLERVHAAIGNKVLPERIDYREDVCGYCSFAHICLPDVIRQESAIITDEEFIERLNRRESLAQARSEYENLDRSIKNDIKERVTSKALAGEFVIQISKPIEVAEKVVAAYSFQKVSIKKITDITIGRIKSDQ